MQTQAVFEKEEWRDCIGYSGKYSVSNLGRVRNNKYTYINANGVHKTFKPRIKKLCETSKRADKQGYLCTRLLNNKDESKSEMVHILVAKAFIPNPNKLPCVNHINGNKHDNRVENLEWCSYSENNQHAYSHGLKTDNCIILQVKADIVKNIYFSISYASRSTGISRNMLQKCLNNGEKDGYGYNWIRFSSNDYCITKQADNIVNKQMKIKVKYFDNEIEKISKINNGDWIDLRAAEEIVLHKGDFKLIPLGIGIILPDGYEAHIVPRSSMFKTWGIIQTNHIGIIDNSYSGDNDQWKLPVYATRNTIIKKGDRICQFRIVENQPEYDIVTVNKLNDKSRGGFGSTNK